VRQGRGASGAAAVCYNARMQRLLRVASIGGVAALTLAVVVVVIPIIMRARYGAYQFVSAGSVPRSDVAIVLGASVARGIPSPVLAARADAAVELYQSGKVSKILVTGDNGALSHDEVTPVRKYLINAGVAPSDIFLDHAGFDTYSSMYRARRVFQATSATIVTQDFHMPRSLFVARSLGLDAYGYDADNRASLALSYFREIPASLKAVWDVVIHREPKYLGPAISLESDGEATWY
jgi:SanA protein